MTILNEFWSGSDFNDTLTAVTCGYVRSGLSKFERPDF